MLNNRKTSGFGIGSLRAKNLAFIAKWWWQFKTEENALLRKVIVAFHGRTRRLGEELSSMSNKGV